MEKLKGKTLLCLAFVTSILLSVFMISPVSAQPTIGVEPSSIVNPGLVPGSKFMVEIWVRGVTDLQILEFHLGYNTTVLTATSITYGGIFGTSKFEWAKEIHDDLGWLAYSVSPALGQPGFTGSGRVAIINFTVGSYGESTLDLYQTELRDSVGNLIDHTVIDGYFRNVAAPTPDFSISASPGSLTIQRGSSGTSTITVTATGGFSSAVSLSASGVPTGVTTWFDPASVTPPGTTTSTLTLTASATATLGGPVTVTITGTSTSPALTHTTTISLTVTSEKPQYRLTITVQGSGTTNPAPGVHTYYAGTMVPVDAIPDSGYMLNHWELDTVNVGAADPYSVTMNANHTLHAVFSPGYSLTITSGPGGTTAPSPDTYSYVEGTVALVTAIPDAGYLFNHWELDGVNVGDPNPIEVTMDADHALHAVFSILRALSIKLSGEVDYLLMERVRIRVAALVRDAETAEPVSDANVIIEIYDPEGELWVSAVMLERLEGTGIYEWVSSGTISELKLRKGVYLVRAQASFGGGPTAHDILEFHIDPPFEEPIQSHTILLFVMAGALMTVISLWCIDHRRLARKYHSEKTTR